MNESATTTLLVVSFYKFVKLDDLDSMRTVLLRHCLQLDIRGTILLAEEGINGTVAGSASGIEKLLTHLRSDPRLSDLEYKLAHSPSAPFLRMKVRLKKEIVTMGVTGIDAAQDAGTYVEANQWNDVVQDPNVVVIDARNDYEVALGKFPGAINPRTSRFGELPDWLADSELLQSKPTVAMYCTGGIRCEKSTALLKSWGFENVLHLKGGILKYLESVDKSENLFDGECFVFDERVSVTEDLEVGNYILCRACRMPVSEQETKSAKFETGISCPDCHDSLTPEKRERLQERQRQTELARRRNVRHIGASYGAESNETRAPASGDLPVLYSFRRCPYAMRARMALSVSGTKCQIREIVLRDKPDAMLAASGKGEVPVLVLNGTVLDQSLDIMFWCLSRHDPQQWLSPEQASVEQMRNLIELADGEFKFHLDRYKYANRYEGAVAEQHRMLASMFVHRLHARLLTNDYLFGSKPCLADIAIFPFIRQFANTDRDWFDDQPWSRVSDWLASFLDSVLFKQIMFKYDVWIEGDPIVVFPLEPLTTAS